MEVLDELREERFLESVPLPNENRIRSTTGTRAAVEHLAGRVDVLERAVRELTVAVRELSRPAHGRGV
jgi:hypothetical protein